jgi:2-methylcitrate dehydratase
MSDRTHDSSATIVRRLAEWVNAFAPTEMTAATAERARAILLDSIACALYASEDATALAAIRAVRRLGGSGDCAIIGTDMRTTLPLASFANGVLIRTLDFNDTYAGPRQIGHPSDNIGAALAAAETADRSGHDLLQAIRLGYEVYGRILDLVDPDSPWDHVTTSGVTVAAMTGWLLRQSSEQLAHAIALAASHSATLGQVRAGHVSAAKSIANAMVVQTATLATLLAAEGMTGPAQAIEGERGLAKLVLDGADFGAFFTVGQPDRLLSVGLKPYPCFALGQGPISAAIELRQRVAQKVDAVERIEIALADSGPARLRLRDAGGRAPGSREAADHSVYFLTAIALLEGRFGLDQFAAGRWRDPDVAGLMARIEARIDPDLRPVKALPCRLVAIMRDGSRHVIERPASPGNPALPLSWDDVKSKFQLCAAHLLDEGAQRNVIDLVERIDELPSLRSLLNLLLPKQPKLA